MSDQERIARLEQAGEDNAATFLRIEDQHIETAKQLGGISRSLAYQEGQFTEVRQDVRDIKLATQSMTVAADQVVRATNGGIRSAAQRAAMPLAGGGAVFGLVELLRAAGIIAGG